MSDFQAMFLKEWQELFAIPSRVVSERSASIRNAQQSIAYGGLVVALVITLPINSLPPPVRHHLLSMLLSLSPGLITVLLVALLVGLDAIVLYRQQKKQSRLFILRRISKRPLKNTISSPCPVQQAFSISAPRRRSISFAIFPCIILRQDIRTKERNWQRNVLKNIQPWH